MRALVRDESGAAVLRENAPEPLPGAGEVLVRVQKAGLTSLDALGGGAGVMGHAGVGVAERVEVGAGVDAEQARGLIGKTVVVGGVVACGKCARCGSGLSAHCEGLRVLGRGGFAGGTLAERVCVPVRALEVLPPKVEAEAGALVGALALAAHAARLVRVELKPYVTVLGDGVVGLLAAQLLARSNASVRVLGHHPRRMEVCAKWGIKHRAAHEVGLRRDQDVVLDCTGMGRGLEIAGGLVRPRGSIVVVGAPDAKADAKADGRGDGRAESLRGALAACLEQEATVQFARGGSLSEALAILRAREADVLPLLSRRVKLAEAGAWARTLAQQPRTQPDVLSVLVDVA